MSTHLKTVCRECRKVIRQCRCPGPKAEELELCSSCKEKTTPVMNEELRGKLGEIMREAGATDGDYPVLLQRITEYLLAERKVYEDRIVDMAENYELMAREMVYRGNSVQHWWAKAEAYGGIVFAVCEAFRSLGYKGECGDVPTLPGRLRAFAQPLKKKIRKAHKAIHLHNDTPYSCEMVDGATAASECTKTLDEIVASFEKEG